MEKNYVTENGVNIYGYPNTALHGFFISLFVRAGSMYESERDNGITHFLEHVAIRNINKLMGGGMYAELDRLGVEFNACTYSEMVQFYLSGASDKFSYAVDVICRIFSPIILSPSETDAERKRIKAEIRESGDKSSLLTFTNGIVHKGTPLARSITGSATGVGKITVKRLEEYRRAALSAENIFFYVTGNFTDGDIRYLSERVGACELFPAVEVHRNIAPLSKGHFSRGGEVFVKNDDYTAVRFTFDLDMSKVSVPETDLIYDILLSGYNSEFFMEMSERRGLFYDINGAVERYGNIGEFYFSYEVRRADLYDAVSLTVDILNAFKRELQPSERLMKSGYVDNAYMLYDDAREFNFTMAYDNHIMGLGYPTLDARRNSYDRVTPSDIRRAAREIFRPENLTLTLKGEKKKIDTACLKRIAAGLDI